MILLRPARRVLVVAVACGGAFVTACAPERIPGSTVSQGDAGIAFRKELASGVGAGSALRGPNSGASYGGGSSSSTRTTLSLLTQLPDLAPNGKACDWYHGAESPGTIPGVWPGSDVAAGGAGREALLAANCAKVGAGGAP